MGQNENVINKAAIETSTLTNGLLNAGQAKKFLTQVFESTPLLPQIRHELKVEKSGEVDKIGINSRILRAKTENTDDGYRASVTTGVINYTTTAARVPWEITEETLRENIEGESLEAKITNLMTSQIGVDTEDILFNGDTATASTDPDYDFLKLNDGFIKQITAGGHVYNASALVDKLEVFKNALQLLPNKYNNGKLKWFMSPAMKQDWQMFLLKQAVGSGGIIPDKLYTAPMGIEIIESAQLPNGKILLSDPKNLIEVNTYNVKIRKTTEGESAIMKDKRFYVVHFDFDAVIEELAATGIITNISFTGSNSPVNGSIAPIGG